MDQRVTDQPAFLLHRRAYRESSLVLELISRDYGRLGIVARGARKSKTVAHYQVARFLHLGWSGRGELKTLNAIDSQAIRVPSEKLIAVYYLNELLLYLLPLRDPHPRLFDAYRDALIQLAQSPMEPLLRAFEYGLLQELGLLPDLNHDTHQGAPVMPEGYYHVDPGNGVIAVAQQDAYSYPGSSLIALASQRPLDTAQLAHAKRLMRSIIDFNLHGRTLQSRKLYQQMMQTRHVKPR